MIYITLLIAVIARLINFNQSLWLDEAISLVHSQTLGFWHFVAGYPIGDFHPPGYFAVLWLWTHLFGISEISARFPSIVFGVLTVWTTYSIGKKLFNKKVGIIGSLLLAINPLHVYYSQEARMYSMATFAVTLSTFFLLRLLKSERNGLLFYVVSVVLILYSDYLAYLILPTQLIFVFLYERGWFFKALSGQFLGGLFLIPWLFVFPEQLKNGIQTSENVPGWKKIVGNSSLKNLGLVFVKSVFGRVTLLNKQIYYSLITLVGVVYAFICYWAVKKFDRNISLIIFWIFIPTFLAFLISFYTPVLQYFRMLFIVPAICLLLAVGLTNLPKKIFPIGLGIVMMVNIICLGAYYLNPQFQREDWKGLEKFFSQVTTNDSIVIFEDSSIPAPYAYYDQQDITALGGIKKFPANSEADVINLGYIDTKYKTIYLVDYLVEIADSQRLVDKKLTTLGWKVKKVHNFNGVGFVYEYSK